MGVDVVRFALATRSWGLLLIILVGLLAVVAGLVVQTVLPWSIYPFV